MKEFNERLTKRTYCEGEEVLVTEHAREYQGLVMGLAIRKLAEYENIGTPEEFAILKATKKIDDIKKANEKLTEKCIECDDINNKNLYKITHYLCRNCLVDELNCFKGLIDNDEQINLAYTLVNTLKDEYSHTQLFNENLKIIADKLNMKLS